MVRNVLLITPHFPPDASAGAHRVRLLAPYLTMYGWEPTVLTCQPDAYEGQVDYPLLDFVPSSLRVIRTPAWSPRVTRRFGVGDLGLRSFLGLWREAARLCARERVDAVFVTIFPAYTAMIGPLLVRRFGVPFVLDYQDPWVNAWGADVGGGVGGAVDVKSRLSRHLAEWLEPHAVRAASAITAVSAGTYEPVLRRHPEIRPVTDAIPLGAEPLDFTHDRPAAVALPFDPTDGRIHLCYTGTVLPLGQETLRALLTALCRVRDSRSDLYARVRVHFIGTSNQHRETAEQRVMPVARALGVADIVDEHPARLPYSTIVHVQRAASILLALGSSEPHYTASKIFPLVLARRPLLAVFHESSSVRDVIQTLGAIPSMSLVTYSNEERAESKVDVIHDQLVRLIEGVANDGFAAPDRDRLQQYFARTLAGRLARVLDQVVEGAAA